MPNYLIKSVTEATEDSYEDGEIGGGSSWVDPQTIVTADTPAEAVREHIETLGYVWNKGNHDNKSYYTLVDENNAELSAIEHKAWKENSFRAWSAWVNISIYELIEIEEL